MMQTRTVPLMLIMQYHVNLRGGMGSLAKIGSKHVTGIQNIQCDFGTFIREIDLPRRFMEML